MTVTKVTENIFNNVYGNLSDCSSPSYDKPSLFRDISDTMENLGGDPNKVFEIISYIVKEKHIEDPVRILTLVWIYAAPV